MKSYHLSSKDINLIDNTLSSIADLTYQGIVILNDKGQIIYFNKSYGRLVKKSADELMGRTPSFIEKNFKKDKSKMMLELKSGNNWLSEYSLDIDENKTIYLSSHIVPLFEEDKLVGYICYFNDITEKINIEKKLIESNKSLIDNINQLKHAQSNMIHHEKLAGIGHLSAGVAHELNNPLGFVKSNIDVLSEYVEIFTKLQSMYDNLCDYVGLDDFKRDSLIKQIKDIRDFKDQNKFEFLINDLNDLVLESAIGIKRASKIVEALRQFSARGDNVSVDRYNINEGIETTLLISKNHWKYDIEIQKNLSSIPNITANGNEINQVFLNLITNSVHAIRERGKLDPLFDGKGKITIDTYADSENVIIDFKDNGCGINKANLKEIFNPFFTTKPVGTGTGLGLNISYNIIVNKHGGSISVDSEHLQGTVFKISLPIYQDGGCNESAIN